MTFDASASLAVTGGGLLSLASMAVPRPVLATAHSQLSGAGSTLRLAAVTVLEYPDQASLTGTTTVEADGSKTSDPPGLGATSFFTVTSGPCVAYGRCVGRAGGYMGSEACAIAVGRGGGVLGACGVFDMYADEDYITLPDGSAHSLSDCPVGAALWRPEAASAGPRTPPAKAAEALAAPSTAAPPRARAGSRIVPAASVAAGRSASRDRVSRGRLRFEPDERMVRPSGMALSHTIRDSPHRNKLGLWPSWGGPGPVCSLILNNNQARALLGLAWVFVQSSSPPPRPSTSLAGTTRCCCYNVKGDMRET